MRLLEPQSIHESGNIVSKIFGGIDAFGLVRFTCPSEVQRDAGKVLGVLCHLEGVTSVFGGQIRNENKRLSASLLVIVHHDVVGFDLRHWSLSIRTYSVSLYASKSKKKRPGWTGALRIRFRWYLDYGLTGTGTVSGPAAPLLTSPTLKRTKRRMEIFSPSLMTA